MIPAFKTDGNLPQGVHQATLQEVYATFGMASARRKWLMANLERIIELAKSTGCLERIIVWGSFVTRKDFPKDIDLLLIMNDDFALDSVAPEAKPVFDHVQGRIAFNADIFWARSSIGEQTLNLWLETYQLTRDFETRGIVEIKLND